LDELMHEASVEFHWKSDAGNGEGAYVAPLREFTTVSSTSLASRKTPASPFTELSPEETDVRLFEQRLEHAAKEGAFLALSVSPRRLLGAERNLAAHYGLDIRSLDALLIRHMKEVALEKKADWQVVLRADSSPQDSGDWRKLLFVVKAALPRVKAELSEAQRTVLLTNTGLLARYDQLEFVNELRDTAGRPGGPPGLWLLITADAMKEFPVIDGKPVPVFTTAQWARIPEAWLEASF